MSIKPIFFIIIVTFISSIFAAPVFDNSQLVKRGSFSGDGTFYAPGLGSCGIDNSEDELVVALNHIQMGNTGNPNYNPKCGKYIKVKGPNGSTKVKVIDTCPGCAYGDLDLSPAAFAKIGDFDDGRIHITWSWA